MVKDKKTRVLVVAEKDSEFYQWLSSILAKDFIVKKLYVQSSSDNPPFFPIRWFLVIKKYEKILKNFKPNKIIIYGGALISIWLIVFLVRLLRLKIEIILFRHDIEHFRQFSKGFKMTFGHYITRKLEKFCFLKADKIIHKGLENELKLLPFYKKIKNKQHYLFREFLDPKLIQKYDPKKKLSVKDGEIHLVFVGSFYLENLPYTDSMWEFYPKVTRQKLHLHIYSKVDKTTKNKLKDINSKNPYFHYEGYMPHNLLVKEISKYDYGISLHAWNRAKIKNNYFLITGFGNKLFDYISAFLPLICSDDATATVKFIDKYNIGLHIDYEKIDSLKNILVQNKKKYSKIVNNINNTLPQFLDHRKFLKFIGS